MLPYFAPISYSCSILQVPPPITRREPAHVIVDINTTVKDSNMTRTGNKFQFWTFDDCVPGPIIRTRVGDYLEVR